PEESAQTGRHQLPKRANLQGTSDVIGFIKLDDPAQAPSLMEKGPLYIRSHTLNLFQEGRWQADVIGGVWVEDKDDGKEDGMVTFRTPERPVAHEVFLLSANGYTLPGIQDMTAIALPRVFAMPGDVLQTSAAGDFRYKAVSAPLIFDRLPNSVPLTPGTPQSSVHTMMPKGDITVRLHEMSATLFSKVPDLPGRIATLRRLFAEKYQYSGVMTNPNELDPLQNFLFDERRGYCDFFATAGALLLRDAGVSTRMAYGFATDEYNSAEGLFTFRNRNAHTWTEVYIDKIGWTVCDFTPSENIGKVPGSPPEPPPPPQFDPAKFDDAAKHEPPPPPPPPSTTKSEVDSDFFARLLDSILKQPWVEVLRQYGPIALLSAVGLFLVIRFFRRSKEDAAAAAAAKELAAREKQPAYFMEFMRVTAAAGNPKPDGATPMEH
ncbi:MAG: transglutaminase domain-containing protein, partial [Verrucomicrobiaceae bacterium]